MIKINWPWAKKEIAEEPKKVKEPSRWMTKKNAGKARKWSSAKDNANGWDATALNGAVFQKTPRDMVAVGEDGKALGKEAQDEVLRATFDSMSELNNQFSLNFQRVSETLLNWYVTQSFIGFQSCSLIAQHWLVSKACLMPAMDAVRNGFNITSNVNKEIDMSVVAKIRKANERFKLAENLEKAVYFNRVFGIRHVLFLVEGVSGEDLEAPFNMDAVTNGRYRGMVQIDPYWITPELDQNAISNPAHPGFYEPTWWRVYGQRIHKSHFVILRGPEVSDILKPSYLYGGIPLTQMIYERVYAAERTANEAPELAMTKRIMTYKTDVTQVVANQQEFEDNALQLTELRDNFGFLFHGLEEEIGQKDLTLTDFPEVVEQQYSLVASISGVPSTKLMGSSPEGFQSTGDHEDKNYRETLESIQAKHMTPIVNRHMELMMRSGEIKGLEGSWEDYEATWKPTSVPTIKELADANYTKANTDSLLRTAGSISPLDSRKRLANDPLSGYDGIDADNIPEGGYPPPEGKAATEEKPTNPKEAKVNAPQTNTATKRAAAGSERKRR